MSISANTVVTMTLRELISALKAETDRAAINQLVYQIDTRVGTQQLQIQELLKDSTKRLKRAYDLAKPADHMSAGGNISREALVRNANTADALGSHAYYYTQVALATAWREYLWTLGRARSNFDKAVGDSEKNRTRLALASLANHPPELEFSAGCALRAYSPFRQVQTELNKLHLYYGLNSLYAYETPEGLFLAFNRASEALKPVWAASMKASFRPSATTKGGAFEVVISLT